MHMINCIVRRQIQQSSDSQKTNWVQCRDDRLVGCGKVKNTSPLTQMMNTEIKIIWLISELIYTSYPKFTQNQDDTQNQDTTVHVL